MFFLELAINYNNKFYSAWCKNAAEGNTVRFGTHFVITYRGSIEFENIIVGVRKDRDITIEKANNNGYFDVDCTLMTKIEKNVGIIEPSPLDNLQYTYLFPNPGSNQLELLNYDLLKKITYPQH